MTFDAGLLRLMTDEVTVKTLASHDVQSRPVWNDDARTIQARVVYKSRMVRDSKGQERICRAIAYLSGDYGVQPTDYIRLPDGSEPQILRVETYPEPTGRLQHQVVYTL